MSRKLVTPTPDHVSKLIHAAEQHDPVIGAAVALAFVTGARRGELCALRWSDIDLDVGVLHIERSLTQVDGEITVKPPKTDRARTVTLDERSVAVLRAHRSWQERLGVVP